MNLASSYTREYIEAGVDEAGRGCLAGIVVAAAVILPKEFQHDVLRDSKQLTASQRKELKFEIQEKALAWSIAEASPEEIDRYNILQASILAMHRALDGLSLLPELLLIDGNRFKPYNFIPHHCIVKGDDKFFSIAAASILAKTYRDEWMLKASEEYPLYDWENNMGYPTVKHRKAIIQHGFTPYHRLSFKVKG
jgi:ribonuclease HII